MKSKSLIWVLAGVLLLCLCVSGVTAIPCNTGSICNDNTLAYYGTIQAAIDAASPSDTITVYGASGGATFAGFTVNKQLTINGLSDGNGLPVIKGRTDYDTVGIIKIKNDFVTLNNFTVTTTSADHAYGVRITSSHNTVTNTVVNGGFSGGYGIFIGTYPGDPGVEQSNNLLQRCSVSGHGTGIYLNGGPMYVNNLIDRCIVTANQDGILLRGWNNVVSNSDISGSTASGIYVDGQNNNVYGNTFHTNADGIRLVGPSNNIYTNTFTSDTVAIRTYAAGINNVIYNNKFTNSLVNAMTGSPNIWNVAKTTATNIVGGATTAGNYWDTSTGSQAFSTTCTNAGDGTCTAAFVSSWGINDLYPLTLNAAPSGTITVTAPTGGVRWYEGTTHAITWTYTGNPAPAVTIEIWKGAALYNTLSTSTPKGSGTITWNIPIGITTGTDYWIKVYETATPAIVGQSAQFNIPIWVSATVQPSSTGPAGTVFTIRGSTNSPTGSTVYITCTDNDPPTLIGNLPKGGVKPNDFTSISTTGNGATFGQATVQTDGSFNYPWNTGSITGGPVIPGKTYGCLVMNTPVNIVDAIAGTYPDNTYTKLAIGITGVHADYTADKTSCTAPCTVSFTDVSTGIPIGVMDTDITFGDGASYAYTSGWTTTHIYSAGTWTPQIHACDDGGTCDARSGATITVTPGTPAPTVSSVSPSTGTPAGGTMVTISGSGFTGLTAITFGGTPAAAPSIISDTTILVPTPAHAVGIVDVAVTTPGGTVTKTAAYTYAAPVADFGYGPTSDFTVQFTDASTNTPTSWDWNFGDGTPHSTQQNPAHTFPAAGTYSVTLTATNSGGSSCKNNNVVVLAPTKQGETNVQSQGSVAHSYTVTTASGPIYTPPGTGVGKLAAKVPMRRNGDGPTQYVYVDETGTYDLGTRNSLPTNVVMQAEDPLSETNGVSTSNSPGQIGFGVVNGLTLKCSPGNCANNYAVLIDGGKSADDNHIRYWNDISFMYQVLTKVYGYPKANIKVLMSDGTDSGLDRHNATVGGVAQHDSSPLDLDSDGNSESQYISAATRQNLIDTFNAIGSGKGSNDNLFIFTTGHGGPDPLGTAGDGKVIYYLWNQASITDTDFESYIPTTFGTVSMAMEQCYGGGFSDNFLVTKSSGQKRYLSTAANNNEPSYGNGWSNVFTRGVGSITDAGKPSTEADVSPYGDSNGKVAQPEVCAFAKATDPAATTTLANYEHPQCGANTAAGTATSMYLISTGWIADNQVTLIWPNLAETLYAGFPYDITWTNSPGVANVNIDLLNAAGSGSTTAVCASYSASTGKYTWPLTATRNVAAGTQYRIKISDAANAAVNDTSDWNFEMKTGGVAGSIKVTANPYGTGIVGTDIYLDGVKKGTTSTSTGIYTIPSVAPGSHTIKAMRTGYLDYTTGVTQPSSTPNNPVTFTMDAIGTNSPDDMGTMTITSTPSEAEVWIDGVMKGKTPYSERVIPGTDWKDNNYPRKYSVTVFKEGYKPLTQEVLVSRGMIHNEDQNGHFTLIPSSIKSFNANPNPVAINTPVTLSATVSDSSEHAPAIRSVQYSQDEGVTWLPMQVVDSSMDPPSETVTASLPGFSTPEVKSIQITATDVNGKLMGSDELKIAVFDPSGGYVTGAGYFASPEGTYTKTPDKSGKVVFGLVAKYVKGSLKGETEFVFWSKNTALMAFNSNGYEYLIVNSPKAQVKGTGTINRKGSYTFMLTTQDVGIPGFNGKDPIRMKIWDTATGEVIYDNQMFASDSTAPVMPIDFGNIIVKK